MEFAENERIYEITRRRAQDDRFVASLGRQQTNLRTECAGALCDLEPLANQRWARDSGGSSSRDALCDGSTHRGGAVSESSDKTGSRSPRSASVATLPIGPGADGTGNPASRHGAELMHGLSAGFDGREGASAGFGASSVF